MKTLIADAKLRFDHQESRLYLKEKYTSILTVVNNGSLFTVDQSLISFLSSTECDIVIDVYGNPVKVNREKLLKDSIETYQRVMNEWLTEYDVLSKKR